MLILLLFFLCFYFPHRLCWPEPMSWIHHECFYVREGSLHLSWGVTWCRDSEVSIVPWWQSIIFSCFSAPIFLDFQSLGVEFLPGFLFVFVSLLHKMTRVRKPSMGRVGVCQVTAARTVMLRAWVMGGNGEFPVDCFLAMAKSKLRLCPFELLIISLKDSLSASVGELCMAVTTLIGVSQGHFFPFVVWRSLEAFDLITLMIQDGMMWRGC